MSAAARAAIWERDRAERWRQRFITAPARAGHWAVVRKNDDGRTEIVRSGLRFEDADRIAGQMRDACPDEDIDAGWNYLPRRTGRDPR